MNRLLSELRRRKVGRVILAYATVVFVVLQVADLALEPLGALRLHEQAEPSRAAEVEQVRSALGRLTADARS